MVWLVIAIRRELKVGDIKMKKLLFLTFLIMGSNAFCDEIIDYKIGDSEVKVRKDILPMVEEFKKLQLDEEYELEIDDLCVLYGEELVPYVSSKFEILLKKEGFSIELEGIYGDEGDHLFQVRDLKNGEILGSFNNVFQCE